MCITHKHLFSVEVNICNEWIEYWSHQSSKMWLFFKNGYLYKEYVFQDILHVKYG